MRFALFAILSLLLASFSFAQNAIPLTGTLDVTFVDANGNPLPGATVEYTYVVSGTGSTPDVPTTGTGITDDSGHFSTTLTADARQTIPFKINLTYQGSLVLHDESKTWLRYADTPTTITVDIGALEVTVVDQKGRPIADVPLVATGPSNKVEGTTNLQGIKAFAGVVVGDEYEVVATYGDAEESAKGTPPVKLSLTLPAYDVILRAVDDAGNRVEAGITVDIPALGDRLSGSGEISLTQMPQSTVQVSARYGKATVDMPVEISKDGVQEIIFDLNAPQITNMTINPGQPGEQEVTVEAAITDSKGVGIASATLTYTVDGGDKKAVAMAFDGSAYAAKIPKQKAGARVEYSISAVDRNGNKVEGQTAAYLVKSGITEPGKEPTPAEGGIPWGIIGIVAIVIVIAAVGYMLMKRRGSGMLQG